MTRLGEQGERDHLSIGEVLSLLKEEFPDVTISKIRFLESQGLLDPERTPSGYRKFYEPDVERLRWILRQQRENFLPLKVIRGRLSSEVGNTEEVPGATPAGFPPDSELHESGDGSAEKDPSEERSILQKSDASAAPLQTAAAEPTTTSSQPDRSKRTRTAPTRPSARQSPAVSLVPPPRSGGEESMTFEELCDHTGLAPDRLRELERFGLLSGRAVAGATYYDNDAIEVARIAAAFEAHGVEPRHLKMYKSTAEREVTLFEQVVTPLLKQRNPRSRRQAADTLNELVGLAHELRNILVRHAVDEMGLG